MKKHALSNSLGSFFSMLGAVGLSALGKDFMPSVYGPFIDFAGQIAAKLPINISNTVLGYAILSSIILLI
jgi:hypothetical protein